MLLQNQQGKEEIQEEIQKKDFLLYSHLNRCKEHNVSKYSEISKTLNIRNSEKI